MDEDLPSPVTDYNPGDHTTNALKTSLSTLYIYPNPIDIHATHVNYTNTKTLLAQTHQQ